MKQSEMVYEFHSIFGGVINDEPVIPEEGISDWVLHGGPLNDSMWRRKFLIHEEYAEFLAGWSKGDMVEMADALADLLYVIHGTAIEFGIDLDRIFAEVHRSNLTKLDENGKPIFRSDGKILKSNLYEPPRIREIIYGV